jgi:hypothetical protein
MTGIEAQTKACRHSRKKQFPAQKTILVAEISDDSDDLTGACCSENDAALETIFMLVVLVLENVSNL